VPSRGRRAADAGVGGVRPAMDRTAHGVEAGCVMGFEGQRYRRALPSACGTVLGARPARGAATKRPTRSRALRDVSRTRELGSSPAPSLAGPYVLSAHLSPSSQPNPPPSPIEKGRFAVFRSTRSPIEPAAVLADADRCTVGAAGSTPATGSLCPDRRTPGVAGRVVGCGGADRHARHPGGQGRATLGGGAAGGLDPPASAMPGSGRAGMRSCSNGLRQELDTQLRHHARLRATPRHLHVVLGPRPPARPDRDRWERAATAIEDHRLRWHITEAGAFE
jgi:hypothetical protein